MNRAEYKTIAHAKDNLKACKSCGGRPTTLIVGGILGACYYWHCKSCGRHPTKPSKTYAKAYDRWQDYN